MITGAQHGRHTREWAEVCEEFGWRTNDDVRRLAFYRANGLPESRKDWHPRHHFDKFLDACLKIRGIKKCPDRERTRLVYRIRFDANAAGLDEAYLKKVSTDLTGLSCWDELCLEDLTNFRNAIHNRAGGKLGHDTIKKPRRKMILQPDKKFPSTPTPEPQPVPAHVQDENQPF